MEQTDKPGIHVTRSVCSNVCASVRACPLSCLPPCLPPCLPRWGPSEAPPYAPPPFAHPPAYLVGVLLRPLPEHVPHDSVRLVWKEVDHSRHAGGRVLHGGRPPEPLRADAAVLLPPEPRRGHVFKLGAHIDGSPGQNPVRPRGGDPWRASPRWGGSWCQAHWRKGRRPPAVVLADEADDKGLVLDEVALLTDGVVLHEVENLGPADAREGLAAEAVEEALEEDPLHPPVADLVLLEAGLPHAREPARDLLAQLFAQPRQRDLLGEHRHPGLAVLIEAVLIVLLLLGFGGGALGGVFVLHVVGAFGPEFRAEIVDRVAEELREEHEAEGLVLHDALHLADLVEFDVHGAAGEDVLPERAHQLGHHPLDELDG
eukprot:1194431-Prorocentrum_minimum.AAC.9